MEDAGDDLGRAEEESHVPQVKAGEARGGAAELDRPEIVVAGATTNAGITAEAGLAQTEGAATAEVVASRPATDEAAAGEIATAEASSGPNGLGDLREAAGEVMTEVPMSMRVSEPPAVVTQAASTLELASSATTDAPAPEMETGVTTGSLFFGATSNPERASHGAHDARMVESNRGEASPTPRAAAKGASGGKALTTSTGSGVSSQSSAGQLQKEWADTASSAGPKGSRESRGGSLTLAELSKQLSTIRTSLENAGLQFTDAAKTVNVSVMFLAFDFFCRLCRCAS
jgi:hypothetical protein